MMSLKKFFVCMTALGVMSMATAVRAQYSEAPKADTIQATGTVNVKKTPTILRVVVPLSCKGKNLKEALDKLKDRCEVATAAVVKLKADKKNIKFNTPSISSISANQQRQMEMLIAQRMGQGKKPKGLQAPESVAVVRTMTVEWPLTGKTPEEILLETYDLKKKIAEADLNGKKNPETLSPEEEEIAAESEQAMRNMGEDPQTAMEPQFHYVASISEEERQQSMNKAFARAKENGQRLAKAAGIELGPLVGISGYGQGSNNTSQENYGRYGRYYSSPNAFLMSSSDDDENQQQDEAVSVNPETLTISVVIQAVFKLNASK